MWENFPQDTNRACSHLVPQTLQEHALLHVWMQRVVPSPGCWHYHVAVLSLCHLLCPLTVSLEFPLGPGQPRGSQGHLNSSGLLAVPVVLRSFPIIRTSKRGGPKDSPRMGPLEEKLTRFADRSGLWVQAKVSPQAPLNSV